MGKKSQTPSDMTEKYMMTLIEDQIDSVERTSMKENTPEHRAIIHGKYFSCLKKALIFDRQEKKKKKDLVLIQLEAANLMMQIAQTNIPTFVPHPSKKYLTLLEKYGILST